MGVQTNITNTRSDLLHQIRYTQRIAGGTPFPSISSDREKSEAGENDH